MNYTRHMDHIRSIPKAGDGIVKYNTTYGSRNTGYKGRLFANGISLPTAPRRTRGIAYEGTGVRDWDAQSAY